MAYNDDAVKAKLSSLNETQDSIVTVAQWIMFHRRHADRTASIWLQRLTDSTSTAKRLNLIYLANEVVQQSRARGKPDFQLAFEPLIADASALAYKSASSEVQGKLKRVVEVWRQRGIFDAKILEGCERRLTELDKLRGGGAKANGGGGGKLGGSLFGGGTGGGVPTELEGVSKSQSGLSKAEAGVKPAVDHANAEFAKLTDPNTPLPTPPVHAARLSALMKNLATAQGAVESSIAARNELLTGLETLIASHKAKLSEDETTAADLRTRKEGVELKKKEVEDGIMRGLSAPSSPDIPTPGSASMSNGFGMGRQEVERPEAEGFTPPPPDVEGFTPPAAAVQDEVIVDAEAPLLAEEQQTITAVADTDAIADNSILEQPSSFNEPAPIFSPPPAVEQQTSDSAPPQQTSDSAAAAANDFLNSLNVSTAGAPRVRQASAEVGDPRLKRRKLSHHRSSMGADAEDEMLFGVGDAGGIDEEGVTSALLGR